MINVEKLIMKIALHMSLTKKEFAYAILYLSGIEGDLCKCRILDEA